MASSNTVAGHPIAMKVGGRRLSVSKSPNTSKSYLSTSPGAAKENDHSHGNTQKDTHNHPHGQPAPPAHHHQEPADSDAAAATDKGAREDGAPQKDATSPTSTDQYPRPTGNHTQHDKDDKKDDKRNEEEGKKSKKVPPVYEKAAKGKDVYNHHPPSSNNYTIKQPAGKVL